MLMHLSTAVWSTVKVADESSAFVPFSQVMAAPAELTVKCEVEQIATVVWCQGLQQRRRV